MGLDIVELFMAVEEEFGIAIPDAEAAYMRTVGQLFAYVQAHAPEGRAPGVWKRFVDVIERETAIRRTEIQPSAHFVEDLRLD